MGMEARATQHKMSYRACQKKQVARCKRARIAAINSRNDPEVKPIHGDPLA
jgi:hypothetical protein